MMPPVGVGLSSPPACRIAPVTSLAPHIPIVWLPTLRGAYTQTLGDIGPLFLLSMETSGVHQR
jgi:hypothetical protein